MMIHTRQRHAGSCSRVPTTNAPGKYLHTCSHAEWRLAIWLPGDLSAHRTVPNNEMEEHPLSQHGKESRRGQHATMDQHVLPADGLDKPKASLRMNGLSRPVHDETGARSQGTPSGARDEHDLTSRQHEARAYRGNVQECNAALPLAIEFHKGEVARRGSFLSESPGGA